MAKELNLNSLEKELETSIQEYTNMSLNNEELTKIQVLQILSKEFKLVSDEKARTFNEDIQLKRYELDKDKIYEAQKLERDKFNHEKDINEKNYNLNIKKLDLDLLKVQNEQKRLDLDEKSRIFDEDIQLKRYELDEDIQLKRYELDKDKIYEAQKLERDKFNHEKDINEKNYELNIKKLDLDLLKVQNEQRRLDLDEKIYISNEANKKFEKVLSTSVEILKILIPIIGSICATGIYVKFMKQCMSITMIDNGIVSKPTQEIIKQFDKYAKIKI